MKQFISNLLYEDVRMKTASIPSNRIHRDESAETAMTHLIFFIAAVIIAMGVVAVVSVNVQNITGATSAGSQTLADQLRTDITIVSDPERILYKTDGDEHMYTFYVKNTGKSSLVAEYVTVILNGALIYPEYLEFEVTGREPGTGTWIPGDVLAVTVIRNEALETDRDHRIRISSENGKSDVMNFKIKNS